MTNDITMVQNFVSGMMRVFVKAPIVGIGALILAIRLNPELSTVFAVVIPIVAVLVAINVKMGYRRFLKVQESLDKVNSNVREYLSGVRVVKAFNRFAHEVSKFGRTNVEQRDASIDAMRAMAIFSPAIMLTVNLGVVAILWVGGVWIGTGDAGIRENQVGELVAFINYMTLILFSLMMVSMVFNMFVRARASAQRISSIFNERNQMNWIDTVSDQQIVGNGRVEFQGVYFAYNETGEEPVLRNVTVDCLPGQTVGIVGSTGSGKSTLVSLIPRFFDTTAGRVSIDGVDVKDVDPALLREKIAIVPQRSILFTGTIAQNIMWGNEQATFEDVKHAAVMAAAHEFICNLPDGYDSRIGQRGVNLSGGQKQRLSIARALIRKPQILILDDCTSAVDAATEVKIKDALKQYASNITCVLIAQRITSVMDADKIIVMDQGEIVGTGTHDALMRNCSVYQEIYQSQIGKELLVNEYAK
jgi:ATP-binding cassette subfamily B protein